MLRFARSFFRSSDHLRIMALDGSAWGGDQADDFMELQTDVKSRMEVSDVDQITLWVVDLENSPATGDRFVVDGRTLDVLRVKPWTALSGSFHHYELTCKELQHDTELTHAE